MRQPVKKHDWSDLERRFAEAAAAAGIKPGTLAWYGFSITVTREEIDKILSHAEEE